MKWGKSLNLKKSLMSSTVLKGESVPLSSMIYNRVSGLVESITWECCSTLGRALTISSISI